MPNKLALSIFALYFLILPFVFYPSLADPYELPKVMVFIFSTIFIIGLLWSQIITRIQAKVKLTKIGKLLVWYIGINTVSYIVNGFPRSTLWGMMFRYQGLLTQVCYFLFFLLFGRLLLLTHKAAALGRTIGMAGLIMSLAVIVEGAAFQFFHLPVYNYNHRMAGFFGNPNFAAGFLALAFSYGSFYPLSKWLNKMQWALYPAAIYLTGSRSGLLAFAVAVFLIFVNMFKKKVYILVSVVLITISITILFPRRALSPFENRPVIWQKGLMAFGKKPIFGWGLDNFEYAFRSVVTDQDFDLKNIRVDKAHNEWLEVLVAGGAAGFLVYFLMLTNAFHSLWLNRQDLWAKTNLIALTSFLVLSQLNVLNINAYLFFYLVLAAAQKTTTEQS